MKVALSIPQNAFKMSELDTSEIWTMGFQPLVYHIIGILKFMISL